MTDAERLQDAIGLLPEELTEPVDALRQRKRIFWKPIAAVAASFLLIVGLWQLQPKKAAENGAFSEDAAENVLADRGDGYVEEYAGSSKEHSTCSYAYSLPAKITEVHNTYLVVTLPAGESVKVFFDNLEKVQFFSLGEKITLCFAQKPENTKKLYPNEILINEKEEKK